MYQQAVFGIQWGPWNIPSADKGSYGLCSKQRAPVRESTQRSVRVSYPSPFSCPECALLPHRPHRALGWPAGCGRPGSALLGPQVPAVQWPWAVEEEEKDVAVAGPTRALLE